MSEIKVNVSRKRIKNMYLRIKNGEVYVNVPYHIKDEAIKQFVNSRMEHIKKSLDRPFTIWGIKYDVEYIEGTRNKVELLDKCYCYYTKDKAKSLNAYLAKEVKAKLDDIVVKYQEVMDKYDIRFKSIKIKKMSSRWGSCKTNTRDICLNSELAKYDELFLEYVFCHEIAHIKYPNHSSSFHDFLELIFPNEKKVRKELKNNC